MSWRCVVSVCCFFNLRPASVHATGMRLSMGQMLACVLALDCRYMDCDGGGLGNTNVGRNDMLPNTCSQHAPESCPWRFWRAPKLSNSCQRVALGNVIWSNLGHFWPLYRHLGRLSAAGAITRQTLYNSEATFGQPRNSPESPGATFWGAWRATVRRLCSVFVLSVIVGLSQVVTFTAHGRGVCERVRACAGGGEDKKKAESEFAASLGISSLPARRASSSRAP